MSADPVDEFAATLAGTVRGPRRAKDRLITEITDGLRETTAAHRGTGLDPDVAVERALGEFGRPHELAADCQSELTVAQTRATASVLLLAVAGLLVCWHLLWVGTGWDGWSLAAVVVAAVPTVCALLAAGTLVVTGRVGRHLPGRAGSSRVTAWAATSTSVAMLVVSGALVAGHARSSLLPVALCAAITVGLHAVVAGSARACRRCSTLDRNPASRNAASRDAASQAPANTVSRWRW